MDLGETLHAYTVVSSPSTHSEDQSLSSG